MASIRSKHNNLLNYFLYNDSELSPAYVKKCKKFLNEIGSKNVAPSKILQRTRKTKKEA